MAYREQLAENSTPVIEVAQTARPAESEFTLDQIKTADMNAANILGERNNIGQYTTAEIIALQRLHPEVISREVPHA